MCVCMYVCMYVCIYVCTYEVMVIMCHMFGVGGGVGGHYMCGRSAEECTGVELLRAYACPVHPLMNVDIVDDMATSCPNTFTAD